MSTSSMSVMAQCPLASLLPLHSVFYTHTHTHTHTHKHTHHTHTHTQTHTPHTHTPLSLSSHNAYNHHQLFLCEVLDVKCMKRHIFVLEPSPTSSQPIPPSLILPHPPSSSLTLPHPPSPSLILPHPPSPSLIHPTYLCVQVANVHTLLPPPTLHLASSYPPS